MKTDHKLSRRIPASGVHHQKQSQCWLAPLSPFLKHVNMRTLALLMFVGFAVLNTTHGKDAETKESAFAGTNKIEIVDEKHNEAAHVATEPTGHTTSEGSILWQFMSSIFNTFKSALNDPALIEYAKQQGIETSDSLTTPCQKAASKSPTPWRGQQVNRENSQPQNQPQD
jgi:hypothetical protein